MQSRNALSYNGYQDPMDPATTGVPQAPSDTGRSYFDRPTVA